MLTTTAYTGGVWLAIFFGSGGGGGTTLVMWGAVFLLICTVLNLAHVNVFKLVITLGVYAEMVGSVGVALLLFLFSGSIHFPNCFSIWAQGPHPAGRLFFWRRSPLRAGPSSVLMPAPLSPKKLMSPSGWSHARSFFPSAWWEVS